MAIKVQCPQCKQGFTSPPTLAGKRVACPKCKSPISIPAENFADPPAMSPAKQPPQQAAPQKTSPQRPAAQKAPPPRQATPAAAKAAVGPAPSRSLPPAKQKRGGSGRKLAVLAIVLLLLAAAGGGGYYYFVIMPGGKNLANKGPGGGVAGNAAPAVDPKFDPATVFKYLPDDCIAIASLDLKGAMASPVYQKLQSMAAGHVEKANQEMSGIVDLKIEDIDAIVAGGKSPEETVVVVHTNRALDPAKLFKPGSVDSAKEGAFTLYNAKNGPSFCPVDANTLIAGMGGALKKVLARNAEPNLSVDLKNSLAKADFSKTLVVAAALKDAAAVAKNFGADPRALDGLPPGIVEELQAVLVQAQLGDQIDLSAAASFKTAAKTESLKKMLDGGLEMVKNQKEIPEDIRSILKSITLGSDQSTLNAAVKFDVAPIVAAMTNMQGPAKRAVGGNNLKMLALAMLTYEASHQRFPPRAGPQDKPLLSWRVMILPFVEEKALYEQFHLDEPWDSEHNKTLIAQMPAIFQSPTRPKDNKTTYLVPVGKGTIYEDPKGFTARQVSDGMSKTIMIVEAAEDRAVVWTKPADFEYNADKALDGLGENGFSAAFADGAVRLIKATVPPETIRAFFSRAGGEPLTQDDLDK